MRHLFRGLAALLIFCFAAGCASEFSLKPTDPLTSHFEYVPLINTGSDIGRNTENYLRANLLDGLYKENPDELIQMLDTKFRQRPYRETLEALTDICYWQGRNSKNPDMAARYYLSTAQYAYFYLFQEPLFPQEIGRFDPLAFMMSRYYNNSLLLLFNYLKKEDLLKLSGFVLYDAVGRACTFKPMVSELPLPIEKFRALIPCANYLPQNALTLSHRFGIGVPLIAELEEQHASGKLKYLAGQTFPVTLFLRFIRHDDGRFEAMGELYDAYRNDTVKVNESNPAVPIEQDFTTPLAYMMRPQTLRENLAYMLNPGKQKEKEGLSLLMPYDANKIPVVLVHGLMSDEHTWAQMINSLLDDARIRKNYQFWVFSYSTGNPILYSASLLRAALDDAARQMDPDGKNVSFNRMVIIAHSMGGLLTKTTMQDAPADFGDEILKARTLKPLSALSPETRAAADRIFRFKRLPYVDRVLFLAVPHRGSEMALSSIAMLGAYLVTFPREVLDLTHTALRQLGIQEGTANFRLATGIENLDPKHPVLAELGRIHFPEDLPYHSIIGNQKTAGVPSGSDGIVPYLSAHLEGAKSEIVVKSDHSVQRNATAIDEIRAILLEHLSQHKLIKVRIPRK